ncbi:hypothetical protein [Peribacillus frigoritolerans]|uniref:hypothetical protein n=1 Tax=Peribacillus frigoritolerans TaxID=450367 RepID=UPI0035CF7A0A
MRKCRKCGEEKPLEEFGELSASKDGKNPRCKPCVRDRQNTRNKLKHVQQYNINKAHKRRAIEKALPQDVTAGKWKAIMKRFGNRCFLTGSTNVSFEHVIPFATGHGGHIVANLLPMDKALNLSRQDKNFGEWFNTLEATIEMHDAFDEAFEYLAELNGLPVDLFWEYVYYCDAYRRTEEEIKADPRPSVEIFNDWKEAGGVI